MLVQPRLQQAILMKELANLRRLQIKNDQLNVFLKKKKAIKSISLSYLGLFLLVLGTMVILEFPLLNSQVSEMGANMKTEVMTLIVCNVLLWIFPILRLFSMKKKMNLIELECHILVEETRHLSN